MGRGELLLLALLMLAGCTTAPKQPKNVLTMSSGLRLQPVTFSDLPDWGTGGQSEALTAFRLSCGKIVQMPASAPVGPDGFAGQAADWYAPCRAAGVIGNDDDSARLFFEQHFRPYRLGDTNNSDQGLLTGYYRPRIAGSRRRLPGFEVPLYRQPPDLVSTGGAVGRIVGGTLQPYYTRAEIDDGALAGRGLELVWLASPIDAFFVSVQGSAEVALVGGGHMRLGVAANNGLGYVAIGRVLVAEGELNAEDVTMQTIVDWLKAHPDQAQTLMERNPRYIFFKEMDEEGPVGAEGVALTAGHSLAIDPAFLPYGAPVFLDSYDTTGSPWRRLMLAQDTGAAIKGPLRGDIYWGEGNAAAELAGAMKSQGRFYLLLPVGVTPVARN